MERIIKRTHHVDAMYVKAALQPKLQARLGIVEQLQAAGNSMTRRRLFHIRRDRANTYRWFVAMRQLEDNGIVRQTGSGLRGDPFVVHLVKPLPALTPLPIPSDRTQRNIEEGGAID